MPWDNSKDVVLRAAVNTTPIRNLTPMVASSGSAGVAASVAAAVSSPLSIIKGDAEARMSTQMAGINDFSEKLKAANSEIGLAVACLAIAYDAISRQLHVLRDQRISFCTFMFFQNFFYRSTRHFFLRRFYPYQKQNKRPFQDA